MFFTRHTTTAPVAPVTAPARVIATAWPAQYKDDEAYFRCRVWDPKADTEPFYMWGPRRLLFGEKQLIMAAMIAAKPEVEDILGHAAMVHEPVEFNQDIVDQMAIEAALHTAQTLAEPTVTLQMN